MNLGVTKETFKMAVNTNRLLLESCIYTYIHIHIQIHVHIHIYSWFSGNIAKPYFGNSTQTNAWTKWPIFCEWHFKTHSLQKVFQFLFYWSLLLSVQTKIWQHSFRYLVGADDKTNDYMTFWLPSLPMRRLSVPLEFNTLRPIKMTNIFQTTFPNAFSWMKIYAFLLWLHWSMFLKVQLTVYIPALV